MDPSLGDAVGAGAWCSPSLVDRIYLGMARAQGRAEWRGTKVSGPWKRRALNIRTVSYFPVP